MRAAAGSAATVRATFDDDAGNPVDSTTTVTVTVADGSGVQTATGTAARESLGVYAYTLAAQTRLDQLTVTFTGTVAGQARSVTVDVDVVARRLVDLHRLRDAVRDAAPDLQTSAPLSGAALRAAADAAEDWIDSALRYPAVRRGVRARWRTLGGTLLRPPGVLRPGELYELVVAGTAVAAADLAAAVGYDLRGWERADGNPWPAGSARVWATHGLAAAPEDLRRAGVVLARYLARTSRISERAASVTTDSTLIVFSKPDENKPTGLPEVDAVIGRLRVDTPVEFA